MNNLEIDVDRMALHNINASVQRHGANINNVRHII